MERAIIRALISQVPQPLLLSHPENLTISTDAFLIQNIEHKKIWVFSGDFWHQLSKKVCLNSFFNMFCQPLLCLDQLLSLSSIVTLINRNVQMYLPYTMLFPMSLRTSTCRLMTTCLISMLLVLHKAYLGCNIWCLIGVISLILEFQLVIRRAPSAENENGSIGHWNIIPYQIQSRFWTYYRFYMK